MPKISDSNPGLSESNTVGNSAIERFDAMLHRCTFGLSLQDATAADRFVSSLELSVKCSPLVEFLTMIANDLYSVEGKITNAMRLGDNGTAREYHRARENLVDATIPMIEEIARKNAESRLSSRP